MQVRAGVCRGWRSWSAHCSLLLTMAVKYPAQEIRIVFLESIVGRGVGQIDAPILENTIHGAILRRIIGGRDSLLQQLA
jgi:hypothetical protein